MVDQPEDKWDRGDRTALLYLTYRKYCDPGIDYKTKEVEARAFQYLSDLGEPGKACKQFPRTVAHGLQCATLLSPARERTRIPNMGVFVNPYYDPNDERYHRKSESTWRLAPGCELFIAEKPKVIRPGVFYVGYYSQDGRIAYAGKGHRFGERPEDHRKHKEWGGKIGRWDQIALPTEQDAYTAEALFIKIFDPPENIQGKIDPGEDPLITAKRTELLNVIKIVAPYAFQVTPPTRSES